MRNLVPLKTNCLDRFIEIVNDKHNPRKGRLLGMQATINTRYNLYDSNFHADRIHLIGQNNYSDLEHTDLLHCYTVSTKSLNKLIKDIKDNQAEHLKGTCQLCGINSDSTIDHYLPESVYPEFCVNALNLLPCCPECNSNKSIFWYSPVLNSREIINPYLDTLPTTQYLFLNISFIGDVPIATFTLNNSNGIPAPLYTIIERHYNRLNLLIRYKDRFHSEYLITLRAYQGNPVYKGNQNLIKGSLLHDAQGTLAEFGANFWKGIIKLTLANNTQFLNICAS